MFLRFSKRADADPRARRLRELLGLASDRDSFPILDTGASGTEQLLSESGRLSQVFDPERPLTEILLNNRSMLEVLRFAAAFVQVPEEHLERGWVNRRPEAEVDWLTVKTSRFEPDDAWLKVEYHGWWFYVPADALEARDSFTLVEALFASVSDAMAGLGSDGKLLPWDADPSQYAGHPRTASSYSMTLQLGREQGVPLMFTLAQLSYWTAKHLGDSGLQAMRDRGRVQVGKVADLTLFDPATVAARATYKVGENGLPPVGIPYVIVNGTIVVKAGEVLPVKPGQPIRFPVEAQGRFQPVDVDSWLGEHAISVPDMHELDDTGAAALEQR